MAWKILLNILYNIAIFLLVLSTIWSINHQRYELMAATVFLMVLIVVLKIRLIKQVRLLTKK